MNRRKANVEKEHKTGRGRGETAHCEGEVLSQILQIFMKLGLI